MQPIAILLLILVVVYQWDLIRLYKGSYRYWKSEYDKTRKESNELMKALMDCEAKEKKKK